MKNNHTVIIVQDDKSSVSQYHVKIICWLKTKYDKTFTGLNAKENAEKYTKKIEKVLREKYKIRRAGVVLISDPPNQKSPIPLLLIFEAAPRGWNRLK